MAWTTKPLGGGMGMVRGQNLSGPTTKNNTFLCVSSL